MKKIRIPLHIFPVDDSGYHIKIKGQLNGEEAVFILDTGASRTVISLEFSQRISWKTPMESNEQPASGVGNNEILNYIGTADIELSTLKIPDHALTIMDLSHVNAAYHQIGIEPIDGIIGSDILYQYHATISFKAKMLYLTVF